MNRYHLLQMGSETYILLTSFELGFIAMFEAFRNDVVRLKGGISRHAPSQAAWSKYGPSSKFHVALIVPLPLAAGAPSWLRHMAKRNDMALERQHRLEQRPDLRTPTSRF